MLTTVTQKIKTINTTTILLILLSISSCKKEITDQKSKSQKPPKETKLFSSIASKDSGIDFNNELIETTESNYYQYNYTYLGGGVATGDFNNDGLVDLFFTSNSNENKLYLNKGDFRFEDITEKAGILKRTGFDTGVTVVDINNDGWLDIYISRGGWISDNHQFANMLYINNGDLTFTESAKKHGLADENRTINTIFFDYDNDNDLDAYVSNTPNITSKTEILDLTKVAKDPNTIKQKGSDRLYENDGTGHFKDVSKEAGILPDLGFGLNPQVADFNNDGWLDIYVSNDFNSPDLAYINNKNGTFTEKRDQLVKHMSFNSMGSDVADINNDGFLDLMTLDMNPEDYIRSKTTMGMIPVSEFNKMVKNGYHYQYMHNMLQLNNGNGTMSDISKMSGIANTDWSWSILSADFDLDGFNDIYVTNGVYRDVIDKDKNNEILQILRKNKRKPTKEDFLAFTKMLPQQKLTNYFYKNNKDLTFKKVTNAWNTPKQTFSNGASYADLDNDGDLDIIVNNINEKATILKNNATELNSGNFLQIELSGPETNRFGIGTVAKITLNDGSVLTRQLINTRGFLSSVSNRLHFGLDKEKKISKLEILWQDGKKEMIINPKLNSLLHLDYANATTNPDKNTQKNTLLFRKENMEIKHTDPEFNDFDLQVLLPHKLSQTGPALAKADVNKDGIEDFFIGGGKNQSGQIVFGKKSGLFHSPNSRAFKSDKNKEDVAATFFDADNDGDLDLYVVSGSYETIRRRKLLQDRLYLNNGKGVFKKSNNRLPMMMSAGSVVTATDFDKDGDLDLFIGGRVIPGKYPHPPTSFLLINNDGKFSIQTKQLAPELEQVGMVTDAVWHDINNDAKIDLILCGEWMGIEVFLNVNGKLQKSKDYPNLQTSKGWWNKLLIADIDNDGDEDILAGNLGLNYKFHASKEKPFHVYTKDFDYNGTEDIFLAKNYKNKQVPVRGKGCSTQQMPHLKNKIKTYNSFANSDIQGILGGGIKTALHYEVNEFRSGVFINHQNKSFDFKPFSNEAQIAPINSILFFDFDKDGNNDLLLAGNNHMSEVETTKSDAGIGTYLKGDGKGNFDYIPNKMTGFFADKDVRNMKLLKGKLKDYIFIANNNDQQEIYSFKK